MNAILNFHPNYNGPWSSGVSQSTPSEFYEAAIGKSVIRFMNKYAEAQAQKGGE
jgi:hypothetical protein